MQVCVLGEQWNRLVNFSFVSATVMTLIDMPHLSPQLNLRPDSRKATCVLIPDFSPNFLLKISITNWGCNWLAASEFGMCETLGTIVSINQPANSTTETEPWNYLFHYNHTYCYTLLYAHGTPRNVWFYLFLNCISSGIGSLLPFDFVFTQCCV